MDCMITCLICYLKKLSSRVILLFICLLLHQNISPPSMILLETMSRKKYEINMYKNCNFLLKVNQPFLQTSDIWKPRQKIGVTVSILTSVDVTFQSFSQSQCLVERNWRANGCQSMALLGEQQSVAVDRTSEREPNISSRLLVSLYA